MIKSRTEQWMQDREYFIMQFPKKSQEYVKIKGWRTILDIVDDYANLETQIERLEEVALFLYNSIRAVKPFVLRMTNGTEEWEKEILAVPPRS